jgi:lipoprotein NlpD
MQVNKISSPRNLSLGQKLLIPYHQRDSRRFIWPMQGDIIHGFGEIVGNSVNKGLNIRSDYPEVRLSASGRIVFSNYLKGWGNTVIVKHGSDFYTIYANLSRILLKEGVCCRQGQDLGNVAPAKDGSYVLHFEIRKKYVPQDPLRYLN